MALDKKISELPALVGSPSLTDLIAIVNLGITKKATLSQLLVGIGAVSGAGTINRIPVWTSSSAQGDSYLLQDGSGVIIDAGKVLKSPNGYASITLDDTFNKNIWTDGVTESVVLLDGTVAQLLWQDNINGGNAYCTARANGAFLQWSDTTATLFATIDLTSQSSLIKYTDTAGGLISSLTLHGGVAQLDFTDGVVTSFIKQDTVGIEINTDGDLKIVDGTQGAGKVLTSDVNGVATWQTPSGGGGTPGGSDTEVQYNNAGAFGGITGATTNGTTLTLVAPILGTPASGVLTNMTGLPLTTGVTGVLPLANGGTNKNMTAVNGGLVWTDADSMEVTAAGTANQILRSGGAAAPIWSTNLVYDGTFLGVGTATPASMIEIKGAGVSNTIDGLRLNQPNVAHGLTSVLPTDTYGYVSWISPTAGGLFMNGISDNAADNGIMFQGIIASTTPTAACVVIRAMKKSGTTVQALAATELISQQWNLNTIVSTTLADGSTIFGAATAPTAMLDVRGKTRIGVATTSDTLADTLIGVSATTQKALVLQAKASQTANLFEVQTSAGVMRSNMNVNGLYIDHTGGAGAATTTYPFGVMTNSNGMVQYLIDQGSSGTDAGCGFYCSAQSTLLQINVNETVYLTTVEETRIIS